MAQTERGTVEATGALWRVTPPVTCQHPVDSRHLIRREVSAICSFEYFNSFMRRTPPTPQVSRARSSLAVHGQTFPEKRLSCPVSRATGGWAGNLPAPHPLPLVGYSPSSTVLTTYLVVRK